MEFNPEELVNTSVEGANSTKITPAPIGDWSGILGKPAFRQATVKKAGPRLGEVMTFMDIAVDIQDQEAKDLAGRDRVSVRHSCILQLDENNQISTNEGDNVDFGRLREACGLNDDASFTPAQFEGQFVVVNVKHRPDPDDPETVYGEVKSIRAPE
jgi:hypothetical protein